MTKQTALKLSLNKDLSMTGAMTVFLLIVFGALHPLEIHAQSPTPAANKLEFEVASVRQNKSDGKASMNVDPTPGDTFVLTGGLYSARNIVLVQYIAFAYKLTNKQLQSVVSQIPWTAEDRLDIEARAEGNPTKDQYRLMMQSLLADRFKMAVHFETRQVPVYVLVLAKPGKLGPQLRMHQANDTVCTTPPAIPAPGAARAPMPAEAERFPGKCGGIMRMAPSVPGRIKEGGRDVGMALIAAILTGVGVIDRPMLDRTGIKGNVDFNIEWRLAPENLTHGVEFHPDESAPPFNEALKEQLGIKMVPQKGPVDFFLIDHLEHPSAN
jgi:uncharacterized protein (TIGR03435 family)